MKLYMEIGSVEIKPNQLEAQQRNQSRRRRLVRADVLVSTLVLPSNSSVTSAQAHFIKGPRRHSQWRATESHQITRINTAAKNHS
jgi:hypothetical protein